MAAGLLFIFAVIACFQACLAARGHGAATIMCRSCDHVTDPAHCITLMACPDEACGMTVYKNATGFITFHLACMGHHECDAPLPEPHLLGKRRPPHVNYGDAVCKGCCETNDCNKDLCAKFAPSHAHVSLPPHTTATTTLAPATTTTLPPLTTTTTLPPTTQNPCHDEENESFKCPDYDQYNFCTDTAGLAHQLAVTRCRKHCGFCSTKPCVNKEEGGFSCATYDANFDLCADVSPLGAQIAHASCPLFCGFCLPDGTIVQQALAQPSTPAPAITTSIPCVDNEDETFNCAEWTLHGFCSATSGTLFEVAKSRCSKTCGFCT